MNEQIARLQKILAAEKIDAFISHRPDTTRFLTGFRAHAKADGQAVVDINGVHLFASTMNREQAQEEVNECCGLTIMEYMTGVESYIHDRSYQCIAIEENFLTVLDLNNLKTKLPGVEIMYGTDLLNRVKRHKTQSQLADARKACEITDQIWEQVLKIIRQGVSERDIARMVLELTEKLGADKPLFNPLVVSGPRSSQPHGQPTDRILQKGDFCTLDMGLVYGGCASDFTRTVVIGEASPEQRRIYETVRIAQQTALEKIMPGMRGSQADKIARDIITDAGYGEYYPHGLGHGLDDGFRLSQVPSLDLELHENMVFTIEPGIYIDGYGGVRIEDTVILTSQGCIPLFKAPKSLIEIV